MLYENMNFLFQIPTDTENINYYDIYAPMWTKFEFTDEPITYTINAAESERFYLVSIANYNTPIYCEELMMINNLGNPFEIKPGIKIKIPSEPDLLRFRSRLLNPTANI